MATNQEPIQSIARPITKHNMHKHHKIVRPNIFSRQKLHFFGRKSSFSLKKLTFRAKSRVSISPHKMIIQGGTIGSISQRHGYVSPVYTTTLRSYGMDVLTDLASGFWRSDMWLLSLISSKNRKHPADLDFGVQAEKKRKNI